MKKFRFNWRKCFGRKRDSASNKGKEILDRIYICIFVLWNFDEFVV